MKSKTNQIIEYLVFLLLGMLIAFTINNKKNIDNSMIENKYLIKECG